MTSKSQRVEQLNSDLDTVREEIRKLSVFVSELQEFSRGRWNLESEDNVEMIMENLDFFSSQSQKLQEDLQISLDKAWLRGNLITQQII